MTDENKTTIIADYLRFQLNDTTQSDKEIIELYGGDTSNEIIINFENGNFAYLSKDSNITVFTIIDTNNLRNSYSMEIDQKLIN